MEMMALTLSLALVEVRPLVAHFLAVSKITQKGFA